MTGGRPRTALLRWRGDRRSGGVAHLVRRGAGAGGGVFHGCPGAPDLARRNFGAAYLASGLVLGMLEASIVGSLKGDMSPRNFVFAAATGVLAGFVYWLIAARDRENVAQEVRAVTRRARSARPERLSGRKARPANMQASRHQRTGREGQKLAEPGGAARGPASACVDVQPCAACPAASDRWSPAHASFLVGDAQQEIEPAVQAAHGGPWPWSARRRRCRA
jgi:hypothetical protein